MCELAHIGADQLNINSVAEVVLQISLWGEMAVKALFWVNAIAALLVVTSTAQAEPPTFELMGYPITPHQVAVLGGRNVQEQSAPTLTHWDMPASPHQVAVLTPRPAMTVTPAFIELPTVRVSAP